MDQTTTLRGQPVRGPAQQDQDLSLQAPQCDPAADGNCAHHHHRGPNRGHRGGHLQDPPGYHRRLSDRAGGGLYPDQLYRSVYQQAGGDQPVDAAFEHPAAGGGDLCGVHPLRRPVRLSGDPDGYGLAQISQRHLHFPLHHAPVDPGRGVAAPVQLQRRHRDGQRPAGRPPWGFRCRRGGAWACSPAWWCWACTTRPLPIS